MFVDATKIGEEVENFLLRHGFEMVDFQLGSSRPYGRSFRIFLDKKDYSPVTIGDCASITIPLKLFLETLGAFDDNTNLEVSSPGLDRILRKDNDFKRFAGSKVRVSFRENGKKRTVVGLLKDWSESLLNIEDCENKASGTVSIDRSDVLEARLVAEV